MPDKVEWHQEEKAVGRKADSNMADFVSLYFVANKGAGGPARAEACSAESFRPPGDHRLYIITPQRSFTPLSGLPSDLFVECTLISSTMDHVCF